MALKTIDNPTHIYTFLNNESSEYDIIFNNDGNISSTSRMHGANVTNRLVDDTEYHTPDSKRYIFAATGVNNGHQHKYYIQDRRNIVSEVRNRKNVIPSSFIKELSRMTSDIDRNAVRARYLRSTNNIHPNDAQLENILARGIYIVEYINVYTKTKMTVSNSTISPGCIDTPLTNYYKTSNSIQLDSASDLSIVIESIIKNSHFNNRGQDWITIRLVTFIPEFVLNDQKIIYLEDQDLVISQDYLDPYMVHPFSRAGRMNKVEIAPPSSFIVNVNDPVSTRGSYWIKIGNSVHKILPNCNPHEKQGGVISITNQEGEIVSRSEANLENLDTHLGIYPTYELALHDGVLPDVQKQRAKEREMELEEHRHNLAINKILKEESLVNTKHNYEMDVAADKFKQAKLEADRKCAEAFIGAKKAEQELELFKAEHNNEWFKYETKVVEEALLSGERLLTKSIDIGAKLLKYLL